VKNTAVEYVDFVVGMMLRSCDCLEVTKEKGTAVNIELLCLSNNNNDIEKAA